MLALPKPWELDFANAKGADEVMFLKRYNPNTRLFRKQPIMNVLGHHIYLGGFGIGMQNAGHTMLASIETWKEGAVAADVLERFPIIDYLPEGEPDLIIANPPCSRFSQQTSFQKYSHEHRTQLETYPELLDVLQTAAAAGVGAVWWETGPGGAIHGRDLIKQAHEWLVSTLGGPWTTFIIHFNLTYAGHPQERPRCHVMHFFGDHAAPPIPERTQLPLSVLSWLDERVHDQKLELTQPCIAWGGTTIGAPDPVADPFEWIKWAYDGGIKFKSIRPDVMFEEDRVVRSIITRPMARWDAAGLRWLDVQEVALLMGYPPDRISVMYDWLKGGAPRKAMQSIRLMSKSISPCAAQYLTENILEPTMQGEVGDDAHLLWDEPAIGKGYFLNMCPKPVRMDRSRDSLIETTQNV